MQKSVKVLLSIFVLLEAFQLSALHGATKKKPWPDINLSTLPSVVGMANSWAFEINQRRLRPRGLQQPLLRKLPDPTWSLTLGVTHPDLASIA